VVAEDAQSLLQRLDRNGDGETFALIHSNADTESYSHAPRVLDLLPFELSSLHNLWVFLRRTNTVQ